MVTATKPAHVTPIHRAAREAAENAIAALRALHDADPFVYAALVELHHFSGADVWSEGRRSQINLVRKRAHNMKIDAVERTSRPPGLHPRTFGEAMATLDDPGQRMDLAKRWVDLAKQMLVENPKSGIIIAAECVDTVFPDAEHASAHLLLSKAINYCENSNKLTLVLAAAMATTKSEEVLNELKQVAESELAMVEEHLAEQQRPLLEGAA